MSAVAALALAPGSELAPGYEVIEHLNRSEQLDVYDAWSSERDCRCVAKLLRPDFIADADARRRLVHEGKLLRRLTHPHLVRAYELLESEAVGPVLILETLAGATLSYLLRDERVRLPPAHLAQLGLQLVSAMHYLHGKRYLHLDLKPSNIVSELGVAKVIDLSLVCRPGRAPFAGIGTRPYLSPEQARGERLTAASDVWGIGATLWTAAALRRPFHEESPGLPHDAPYEQLERAAEPVRRYRRLPVPLTGAIDACLERDPARRPTLAELSGALEPFAD